MNYTPGPWTIDHHKTSVLISDQFIAHCGTEANARLIASAPRLDAENKKLKVREAELFKALIELQRGIYTFGDIPLEVKNFVYSTAQKAITKHDFLGVGYDDVMQASDFGL